MKKYLTLTAVVCALGVTWAVAASPAEPGKEAPHKHPHHAMGGRHGHMQGMMHQHSSAAGHEHGKSHMHGKDMMACDMSSHGTAQHGHRHSTPEK